MICATACLIIAGALVHDGDTLVLPGPNLRLWGASAVELDQPGGPEARDALAGIIAGQTLTCERKGESYKRIVGRCELPDGTDIGCAMIRAGFATETRRYSKGAYEGCKR